MEKLIITRDYYRNILNAGLNSPNAEVCGLLLGRKNGNEWIAEKYYQITNDTKEHALIDYSMNPQEVMEILKTTNKFNKKSELIVVAVWHTHPRGVAIPSSIDVDRVAYPVPYLIYGMGEDFIRTWKIDKVNKSYTSILTEVV